MTKSRADLIAAVDAAIVARDAAEQAISDAIARFAKRDEKAALRAVLAEREAAVDAAIAERDAE